MINEVISFGLKEVIVNSVISPTVIKTLKEQYRLTVTISDAILENDNYKFCYDNITDLRYVTAINLYFII